MITPVPSPPPDDDVSTMDTTLGSTAAATCSTDPSAADVSELPSLDAVRSESTPVAETGAALPSSVAAVIAAPAPPPTSPAATATAASSANPRRRGVRSPPVGGAGRSGPAGPSAGVGRSQGSGREPWGSYPPGVP